MYSKTSIQYRLGPLTGLWVLHTTVQGATDTCYFFRMGELFYQAKVGETTLGFYLCQVEKLHEDVEALELPVPAGTPVQSVALETYGAADDSESTSMLSLKLEGDAYLRFTLDADNIGTRMAFSRESAGADLVGSEELEMCGYDTPVIPLPESVARARKATAISGVLLFFAVLVAEIFFSPSSWHWLLSLGAALGFCLALGAIRFPWRFRCPYCGKAAMRPKGLSLFDCPVCKNICRSRER